VAAKGFLEPYLPKPTIAFKEGSYAFDYDRPKSIGKVKGFYGNFGF
jgi:glycine dehydrogenase (decarboxylating) beta subunit (EC 1.4.4.2)